MMRLRGGRRESQRRQDWVLRPCPDSAIARPCGLLPRRWTLTRFLAQAQAASVHPASPLSIVLAPACTPARLPFITVALPLRRANPHPNGLPFPLPATSDTSIPPRHLLAIGHYTHNTMFRDFSFDPVSQPAFHALEAERAAMNVSPTSLPVAPRLLPSRPPTPPPCTMGDLAVKLNQQNLRIDTRRTPCPAAPLTPPSDEAWELPSDKDPEQAPTYSRISASILRMQRQRNCRMQCSSSHVRDISRLVKMIEDEEQCTVSETTTQTLTAPPQPISPALSPVNPSGDDEGIDMDYDIPSQHFEALVGMPVWRSGDRRHSCIRVTKPVRMRKRSKESVNGASKRESV